jgi:myo-inositol-1(or 4)-monophosphatase
VRLNGKPVTMSGRTSLDGATVLASRSETRRGEWERFQGLGFHVEPMGSVALKLGYVAAGLFDTTWTLVPKNEWDIAAGTALVRAGGGSVWRPDGVAVRFNSKDTKLTGLIAAPSSLETPIRDLMERVSD